MNQALLIVELFFRTRMLNAEYKIRQNSIVISGP